MGRKTFEVVTAGGGLGFLTDVPVYVLSTTLDPVGVSAATVIGDDASDFVRELKEGEGGDIWLFGGGMLFGSLLDGGVVDLVEVAIVPVLLGEGVPLLPLPRRTTLELERTEPFPSGIVLNRYRVERGPTQELSSATGGVDG
jgi:dihydrofolate reductase